MHEYIKCLYYLKELRSKKHWQRLRNAKCVKNGSEEDEVTEVTETVCQ